jgi:hypothetical protein
MIRKDFLSIVNDDPCEAALLATFEYWTNGVLSEPNWNDENEPWVSATVKEIQAAVFGMYGAKAIRERIDSLISRGYLSKETCERYEASRYLLLSDAVNEAIDRGIPSWVKKATRKTAAVGENDHGPVGEKDQFKEEESSGGEECINTQNISPTPSEKEPENEHGSTEAESDSGDSEEWTNDGGEAVVNALRRQPGIKPTPKQRKSIREFFAMVAIRADRIDATCAAFAIWAKDNGKLHELDLIHRGYWLKILKGEKDLRSLSLDADSVVQRVERRMESMAREQCAALDKLIWGKPEVAPPSPPPLPDLAVKWNEVMADTPAPKVEDWCPGSRADVNLQAALKDPGFIKNLDKTLKVCHDVWDRGNPKCGYVTLSWLLKKGIWAEIINGDHNWLLTQEKTDGPREPDGFDMDAGLER